MAGSKLAEVAFAVLLPLQGLVYAGLAARFEPSWFNEAFGVLHSIGSAVLAYRRPSLVTLELLPEHALLRGVREVRGVPRWLS